MIEYGLRDHEPSYLPEGHFKLVWNDEFDGDVLDRSKWDYRLSMMGTIHPAWTDDEGAVTLDGKSHAVFHLIEKDGRPVSAQLQTGYNFMDRPIVPTKFGKDALQWNIGKLSESLFTHKYGYYECRCRLQARTDAWWSAFWVQSPMIGASLHPADSGTELDIMECFAKGEIAPHNAITGGYGLDAKVKMTGGGKVDHDAWHRFGMLWDETGYTFYVDGKENGHISDYVSHIPEFILISTEVKGYRFEDRQPVKEAFDAIGDTFIVDYVRVFDKVD